MSLDDRLNKSDGGFVDTVCDMWLKVSSKIGDVYQKKFYDTKDNLASKCHAGATCSFALSAFYAIQYLGPAGIICPAFMAYMEFGKYNSGRKRQSNVVEEMAMQFAGLPKKLLKYGDIIVLSFTAQNLVEGTVETIGGLYLGDQAYFNQGMYNLTYGSGLLGWMLADYLNKTDVGDPPKKPKKKKVIELVKEWFLRPQPVPVKISIEKFKKQATKD